MANERIDLGFVFLRKWLKSINILLNQLLHRHRLRRNLLQTARIQVTKNRRFLLQHSSQQQQQKTEQQILQHHKKINNIKKL